MILTKSLIYESNIFNVYTRSKKVYKKEQKKHKEHYSSMCINYSSDNFTEIGDVENDVYIHEGEYGVMKGNLGIINYYFGVYLQRGCDTKNILYHACKNGNFSLIKKFMKFPYSTLTFIFSSFEDLFILKKFTKYIAEYDLYNISIKRNNLDVVKLARENTYVFSNYFPFGVKNIEIARYLTKYYFAIKKKVLDKYFRDGKEYREVALFLREHYKMK